MYSERDAHHIVHSKNEWRLRKEALYIREHRSLIPNIPRYVHNNLHRACPAVPLLGYHALNRVAKVWIPDNDTLKSVDNLLFAIEEAAEHPRSHPVESSLAHLAIDAIELQRPFLKEGLAL